MIVFILIAILVIGYFLVLNSKVKNKGATLLEKIITALLSTFLFSLFLAFLGYTPAQEQQVAVGYSSFIGLFILSAMFSLPIFLICGSLYSFFVDIFLDNIDSPNAFLKYISGFFVYLAGGLLMVGMFFITIRLDDGHLDYLLISDIIKVGAFPSLLFYHISLLTKKIGRFSDA